MVIQVKLFYIHNAIVPGAANISYTLNGLRYS